MEIFEAPAVGSMAVPVEFCGCWEREYIKQAFREPRATDVPPNGSVRYLQCEDGVCVDCRIDLTGGGGHDCFVGVTLWDAENNVANWHPLVSFAETALLPPTATLSKANFAEHIRRASSLPTETEDRGKVTWLDQAHSSWLETDVDKGAEALEEKWCRISAIGTTAVASGKADTPLSSCHIREKAEDGSAELLLSRKEHFAHVVIPADSKGPTVFSMGTILSDVSYQYQIEISTDSARVGTSFTRS
eukprot:TRINITY_DN41747_c0_g1_i1.p1 TRINITY_DN41747_c0_g1~~TRINITY_DN41747_c0_g1_i1.p1  ORF type:complete len:246 (-),score=17.25 TRINITY_DN41747_c0_g1_i1:15-752(-)